MTNRCKFYHFPLDLCAGLQAHTEQGQRGYGANPAQRGLRGFLHVAEPTSHNALLLQGVSTDTPPGSQWEVGGGFLNKQALDPSLAGPLVPL